MIKPMCCIEELARKDIINVNDGCRMGFVCDVDIDVCAGRVKALVIYGKVKFFGLFGREDDIVIPWESIQKIGEDIILVCCDPIGRPRGKSRLGFLNNFNR